MNSGITVLGYIEIPLRQVLMFVYLKAQPKSYLGDVCMKKLFKLSEIEIQESMLSYLPRGLSNPIQIK